MTHESKRINPQVILSRKALKSYIVILQLYSSNACKMNQRFVKIDIKWINYKEKQRKNGYTMQVQTSTTCRRQQRNTAGQRQEGPPGSHNVLYFTVGGWVPVLFLTKLNMYWGSLLFCRWFILLSGMYMF